MDETELSTFGWTIEQIQKAAAFVPTRDKATPAFERGLVMGLRFALGESYRAEDIRRQFNVSESVSSLDMAAARKVMGVQSDEGGYVRAGKHSIREH